MWWCSHECIILILLYNCVSGCVMMCSWTSTIWSEPRPVSAQLLLLWWTSLQTLSDALLVWLTSTSMRAVDRWGWAQLVLTFDHSQISLGSLNLSFAHLRLNFFKISWIVSLLFFFDKTVLFFWVCVSYSLGHIKMWQTLHFVCFLWLSFLRCVICFWIICFEHKIVLHKKKIR